MSKVIAICNQKGGVGKTTTGINLGIGLSRKGKKVLLIDFDPQANATQGLGFDPDEKENTVVSLMKAVMNKDSVIPYDETILHHEEGIDLIPSNIDMASFETELISMYFGREKVLKEVVDRISDRYDYIIIDCMPSLNIIALNALVAANEVLIPLQTQLYSVRGLEHLFETIRSVIENRLNENLRIAGILYTCANDRTASFREIREILEKAYGGSLTIFEQYIPRSVKVEDAPSYGKSIYTYAPNSKVAIAYKNFTDEFMKCEGGR